MEDGVSLQARSDFTEAFRQDGIAGPITILSPAHCILIRSYLKNLSVECLVWHKGWAAADRLIFNLASQSRIIARIKELLGPDVILWGACQIIRDPGDMHPWHTDIESSEPEGGFVSVWVGIENTQKETSLKFVPKSHLFGRTVQEENHRLGLRRDQANDSMVLEMARKHHREATIVQPQISDGEAIFFDGRIWHSSHHRAMTQARTALLFQYAAANKKVHCVDSANMEWPFRLRRTRPPCIQVAGESGDGINLMVPPPALARGSFRSLTYQFDLDLRHSAREPWKAVHAIKGATPVHDNITCHASSLAPGYSPHPPHAHIEEELLIMLSGAAEIIIPANELGFESRTERLRPGDFVYYPAFQRHTIRNVGPGPATYTMFKWRGDLSNAGPALGVQIIRGKEDTSAQNDFNVDILFEGPTNFLDRLQAHLTTLKPGGGYRPHSDEYDVAIVVLKGRIAILDRELIKDGVAYCVAGEDHGMRNVGEDIAKYLVFEFQRSTRSDFVPEYSKMPLILLLRGLARRIRRRLNTARRH